MQKNYQTAISVVANTKAKNTLKRKDVKNEKSNFNNYDDSFIDRNRNDKC